MNHIMFGEIDAWYYKALGGIFPDEEKPGFKNVILKTQTLWQDSAILKPNTKVRTVKFVSAWKKSGR